MMSLALTALSFSAFAADTPGAGDAAHFLRDGLGASGRAVGSAYVALASDYTAMFWNPAPVVQSPSTLVGGGLEQRNAGVFNFNVLGGHHVAEGWSAGLVVVSSDLYDVYHAAGGLRFGTASVGLAVRSYQFGVPGDRGTGLALDIGARYVFELGRSTVSLAAVSRDVGWTSIRWGEADLLAVDRASWVNRLAVAVALPLEQGEWTLEFDGELSTRRPPEEGDEEYWEQVGEINISIGTVFQWQGLRVRAGVQRYALSESNPRFRSTVGVGIALGNLSVDLALIPSSLGATYLGGFQVEL